ncbi:MAG: prepilin peptidase [Candidatus Dadabacteria bacterium]|nr:prepilin peptidase [Candidatus Dadabacteria bacterium]
MSDVPPFFILFAFVLGSIIGSFLNVCIYRLPRKQSIILPPSHCTTCNIPIRFYDNVPILSYLLLRGRCRSCGAGFSPRYAIIEALTGCVFALTVYEFGLSVETLLYLILLPSLIVITFIDLEHWIIPNVITYPGIALGLILALLRTDWGELRILVGEIGIMNTLYVVEQFPALNSILGIMIGGGVLLLIGLMYEVIRKREGMGMGDVKLLAMVGAFLGVTSLLFIVLLSSLLGTLVGAALMINKQSGMKRAIPFGPFLSFAAALYCFTGGISFIF